MNYLDSHEICTAVRDGRKVQINVGFLVFSPAGSHFLYSRSMYPYATTVLFQSQDSSLSLKKKIFDYEQPFGGFPLSYYYSRH